MKKYLQLSSLLISVLFLPGCSDNKPEKQKGLIVVNVLDKSLFDDCHIKGSISVPFEDIQDYAINNFDKNAEIVLYCSNYHCSASGQACKQLKKLGFNHVYAYEGGTAEWYQKGLPVEGPGTKRYLRQEVAQPLKQLEDNDVQIISLHALAEKLEVAN